MARAVLLKRLKSAETRVLLFHSPTAARDTSGAMDDVNQWLTKDRSQSPYAHLQRQYRDSIEESKTLQGVRGRTDCSGFPFAKPGAAYAEHASHMSLTQS